MPYEYPKNEDPDQSVLSYQRSSLFVNRFHSSLSTGDHCRLSDQGFGFFVG